jgi:hypothetical protein
LIQFSPFQAETSLMTFEGQQMQGVAKIMEKIGSLTFQKIAHLVKTGTDVVILKTFLP